VRLVRGTFAFLEPKLHRTSYRPPASPHEEPPGTRRIHALDPCFNNRPRLSANADDDRELIWVYRHQDKRYISIPMREFLSPEMAVVFDEVRHLAQAEGKLPCDVWRELAASVRGRRVDDQARVMVDRLRNQAQRWGLQVSEYVDQLEQLADWNHLVQDVCEDGISAAELIQRTFRRRQERQDETRAAA
jgi:hypothetical protein